jgi:hypothetical protein
MWNGRLGGSYGGRIRLAKCVPVLLKLRILSARGAKPNDGKETVCHLLASFYTKSCATCKRLENATDRPPFFWQRPCVAPGQSQKVRKRGSRVSLGSRQ